MSGLSTNMGPQIFYCLSSIKPAILAYALFSDTPKPTTHSLRPPLVDGYMEGS